MKKYISAILIPCMLLQLCGCYSTKYLSSEELQHYYSYDPITITTIEGKIIIIKRNITVDEIEKDSTKIYCSDFYWLNDSLILSKNSVRLGSQKNGIGDTIKVIGIEKVAISKYSINRISVSEYNSTAITIIVFGLMVICIAGAVWAAAEHGAFSPF